MRIRLIIVLVFGTVAVGGVQALAHDPGDFCTHNHSNGNIQGSGSADQCHGTDAGENMYGQAGNDQLSGWAGPDDLYGDDHSDRLYGNLGNDYLYGGTYSTDDGLSGGGGDDEVIDSAGWLDRDVLCDGGGNDIIDMQDGDNYDIWQNEPDGAAEVAVRRDPDDQIYNDSPCGF